MTNKGTEMSTKPETQGERAELIRRVEELTKRFSEGWHDGIKIDATDIATLSEAAALLADGKAGGDVVAWRDWVEQRLLNWRQRTMNRSGDHLALDDFMDKKSLDDLIDYVCSEYEGPADTRPQPAAQVAQPLTRCSAGSDGDCFHKQCPQLRDGEPAKTRRHCPLDHGVGKDQA